jgi:hypothetical protein
MTDEIIILARFEIFKKQLIKYIWLKEKNLFQLT